MRRSHRIAYITKRLVERPYHVFPLTEFSDHCQAARSTISEDVAIIRESFEQMESGKVQTIAGVAGGVRYLPVLSKAETTRRVQALCHKLEEPQRILPGGFIYLNDLVANPAGLGEIGEIFASRFQKESPDYVVTVETAGIPIALMTAHSLNLPLVVVMRKSRLTEGTVVTVNYVSGSSRRIETMSLSRRALATNSRVLLIDDFMRAGGTLKGLGDLMAEFDCSVVGKAVLVETAEPQVKLIEDYVSLIRLQEVDEVSGRLIARPAPWVEEHA